MAKAVTSIRTLDDLDSSGNNTLDYVNGCVWVAHSTQVRKVSLSTGSVLFTYNLGANLSVDGPIVVGASNIYVPFYNSSSDNTYLYKFDFSLNYVSASATMGGAYSTKSRTWLDEANDRALVLVHNWSSDAWNIAKVILSTGVVSKGANITLAEAISGTPLEYPIISPGGTDVFFPKVVFGTSTISYIKANLGTLAGTHIELTTGASAFLTYAASYNNNTHTILVTQINNGDIRAYRLLSDAIVDYTTIASLGGGSVGYTTVINSDLIYVTVMQGGSKNLYSFNVSTKAVTTDALTSVISVSGALALDSTILYGIRAVTPLYYQIGPAAPPNAPTLLTANCTSGIGEPPLAQSAAATFEASVSSGSSPLTVDFTDNSLNTPTSWLWEFGDGTTSTSQNPSHIFSEGIWTVVLTVTNAKGTSSDVMTIIVSSAPATTGALTGVLDINVDTGTINRDDGGSFVDDGIVVGSEIMVTDANGVTSTVIVASVTADTIVVSGDLSGTSQSNGNGEITVETTIPGDSLTPAGSLPGLTIQGVIGKIAYYAVDTENNLVKIHGANGALLKTFGSIGDSAGQFWSPTTCSVVSGKQRLDRVVIEED